MARPGTSTPSPQLARRVSAIAAREGMAKTGNVLSLSRETIARIVARLPVRLGSLALAEQRLGLLTTHGPEVIDAAAPAASQPPPAQGAAA